MTTTQLDSTVLDLIADEAILRDLSRIVATEREIRDIYAKAFPNTDITTKVFPTMMDAAFAVQSPTGATEYNRVQTERRTAIFHANNAQDDAFESLRLRVKVVARNLVEAEVAS
jgi:hypothetical protein